MNNNAWFKKEKPLLSLQSMGGGASGTLMQGAADKTYVDDVYSTYTYIGNGGAQQITNNVDNSKGGLVWMKNRERSTYASNLFFDTERGSTQYLVTDTQAAQATSGSGTGINTFNDNGFTLQGNGYGTNYDTEDFVSWNFREAEGFFDIVTWTGTGSAQNISHSLKCQPGMIIVKCTSAGGNWVTWHQSFPYDSGSLGYVNLNASSSINTSSNLMWNYTAPTSSVFTVGSDPDTNASGETYVAYVFASGASTKQYSVKTDAGNANYMSVPAHSDLELDSDFTVEFWHKRTTTGTTALFAYGDASTAGGSGIEWYYNGSNVQKLYVNNTEYEFPDGTQAPAYKWVHYAICREGTNTRIFVDGELMTTYASHSATIVGPIITGNYWGAGPSATDGAYWSNLRVVKGTALYTAAFTPPQSALTNITNTKLLCWNSQTTTGATVSPVTIVQNGTVTSKTDTPSYSDPECFKFGPDSDKNIIATGMYTGTGGSDVEIDLGWEPQWVLIKNTDLGSENWFIIDSMRGMRAGTGSALSDYTISTNTDQIEAVVNALSPTSTGFYIDTTDDKFNGSGHDYMYLAVRRPDGYVGKPPSAGTGAFTMDTGNGSSTIPTYDSGFPVGMGIQRKTTVSFSWDIVTRLASRRYMQTNDGGAEANYDPQYRMDSNAGWAADSGCDTAFQSWMFKRGQGFDVVAYLGNGYAGRQVKHNLSQTPEMIWLKNRESNEEWVVGHKGINSGTNPWQYYIELNSNNAQVDSDTAAFNDTAPSSTHFSVGSLAKCNGNGQGMLAYLFASANDVDGNPISKVGYYTGTGVTSGHQITLGFQPRFLILRGTNGTNWWVFDTVRGWNGSSDKIMNLDNTDASANIGGFATPNATGFNIITDGVGNNNAVNYIYYAHA